jgi:Domain of unknown function (DUF4864)
VSGVRAERAMSGVLPARWTVGEAVARLAAVGLACWIGAAAAAQTAPTPAEWQSIQEVIAAQRAAIIAGDADKAFGYASPGIQQQFGDAASFLAMVDAAYSALESARYVEFLEGAVIDGIVVQPLRLIDADNTVRVALYTMEKQVDGEWCISSCRIAPSTVRAA